MLGATEHLYGARGGVDKPEPGHAVLAVDILFAGPVHDCGRRREHLARPVGRQRKPSRAGQCGHPFAAPACQVRNQDLRVEVKLGFVEDDPTAWTAATVVERPANPDAKRGTCSRV